MNTFNVIFLLALIACALIILIKVFSLPLRIAMKLALNTFFGFAGLLIFNLIGSFTGITLGVNLLNSVVVGFLGIPGFLLLLLVKWMFMS